MAQEELQDFCCEIDPRFPGTRRTAAVDWCIFLRFRRNYDADSSRAGIFLAVKLVGYPILFVILVVIFYLPPTFVTAKVVRRLKPVSRKPAVWRQFTV
jgi:hypothetical protein